LASNSDNNPSDGMTRDWFIGAIETKGSVGACLSAVSDELSSRQKFVELLKAKIVKPESTLDNVSDLATRIKSLENTLRFRLGILRPERPGAWFRAPAATSTGPFASTLLSEPVFSLYRPEDVDKVRKSLKVAWESKSITNLPFEQNEPSLWKSLLCLSLELEQLINLPEPFDSFKLDELPNGLPPSLDSKALRAFLLNVASELKNARLKLDDCYKQLLDSSDRLWIYQKEQSKRTHRRDFRSPGQDRIDDVRAEFQKRRQAAMPIRNSVDSEALQFMGFRDFPTPEILKQRYLILAKKLHPDANLGMDEDFKFLTKSFAHLNSRILR